MDPCTTTSSSDPRRSLHQPRRRPASMTLAIAALSASLAAELATAPAAGATIDGLPAATAAPAELPVPTPPLPTATPVAWPAPAPGLPSAMAAIVPGGDAVQIDGATIDALLVRELYGPRAFTPLWSDGGEDRIRVLLAVFGAAGAHGLEPSRYHVGAIERRLGAGDERSRAELELLTSDAVMRYGAHVSAGAYRPMRPGKEIALAPVEQDPTSFALQAAAVPDARAYLESLPPGDPGYRGLQEALRSYRELAAAGGWPAVPEGPKISPGAAGPEVLPIRARLAATGDARADVRSPKVYDRDLVEAVERFQERHGLAADGVIGPKTRSALAVSADDRVRQLEVALERWRWRPRDLGDRFVMINVPDQWLELRDRDGAVELEMPVVVGKPSWATPAFSAPLINVVFNPPWNVPPKIARDEILPKARRDASYFSREGIVVRGGVTVASASTDALSDAGGSPGARVAVHGPIRLRQAPGPKNPLGRVKFNIENGFGVYLHDTPNKRPFGAADRRLSHGCIRVKDARALAAAVMRDVPGWDDERLAKVQEGWKTRTVSLPESLPVHILYETAWVDGTGAVQFREDVYERDAELLARWNRPRSARLPAAPAPVPPPAAVEAAPGGDAEASGEAPAADAAAP